MSDISGYVLRYPLFVRDSGFFWEIHIETPGILLEKSVYERRIYNFLWKCRFESGEHLILPCFPQNPVGDEFLTDKVVMAECPPVMVVLKNVSDSERGIGKGAEEKCDIVECFMDNVFSQIYLF